MCSHTPAHTVLQGLTHLELDQNSEPFNSKTTLYIILYPPPFAISCFSFSPRVLRQLWISSTKLLSKVSSKKGGFSGTKIDIRMAAPLLKGIFFVSALFARLMKRKGEWGRGRKFLLNLRNDIGFSSQTQPPSSSPLKDASFPNSNLSKPQIVILANQQVLHF